jgi:hypothetical protein
MQVVLSLLYISILDYFSPFSASKGELAENKNEKVGRTMSST